jgi:hypothetical protein
MAYIVILIFNDIYVIYLNNIQHEVCIIYRKKSAFPHKLYELNVLNHYNAVWAPIINANNISKIIFKKYLSFIPKKLKPFSLYSIVQNYFYFLDITK